MFCSDEGAYVRFGMLRPVFSLMERGPLSDTCTFISYGNVDRIRSLEHLAYTSDRILKDYEERAKP